MPGSSIFQEQGGFRGVRVTVGLRGLCSLGIAGNTHSLSRDLNRGQRDGPKRTATNAQWRRQGATKWHNFYNHTCAPSISNSMRNQSHIPTLRSPLRQMDVLTPLNPLSRSTSPHNMPVVLKPPLPPNPPSGSRPSILLTSHRAFPLCRI